MGSTVLKNWSWKKASEEAWTRCKHDSAVTEIFTDLKDNGDIPDPFYGDNEKQVQWVGETDWDYKCGFDVDVKEENNKVELVFEGLDNYASVYLNGTLILESENMFHIHRVDITDNKALNKHSSNELLIKFKSAFNEAIRLEREHGDPRFVWFGDNSRLFTRKAQYHYGWDWGPVLLTCGPYRPVRLEVFDAKVYDLHINSVLDENLDAEIVVELDVSNFGEPLKAEITIKDSDNQEIFTKTIQLTGNTGVLKFQKEKPKLWYPRNYGNQDMYLCEVELKNGEKTVDSISQKFGLRRVELVQHKFEDQPGSSFFFKVNNIPIYISGSNWIPAHSFTTQLKNRDYHEWVKMAVNGNQNMLRVWGGGLFEADALYEACDEAGVLVWQDFLFACGQYPYYEEFAANIKRECEDQLKRLRKFCSIIIYAGNNEDYVIAKSASLTWDQTDTSGQWEKTDFPARIYYEKILPDIVRRLSPTMVYHYGSPYGGPIANDPTIGDIHQWDVWHGTQQPYQDWPRLSGRFVSEFGMLALPSLKTLKSAISDKDLYPQSYIMDLHNKAKGFEKRLYSYVFENIAVSDMKIESWIYATQLMQAECLGLAYRCWRRNWKGPNREYSAGALVWQLNDCWPVTSWAICDFNKIPKLSYYAIKRECAPVTIGVYRNEKEVIRDPAQKAAWLKEYRYSLSIWGTNFTLKHIEAYYVVRVFDTESGELLQESAKKPVFLDSNRSTEISEEPVSKSHIIQVILYDSENEVVARTSDWPQPLKYLRSAKQNVEAKINRDQISVVVDKPTKGIELIIERNGQRQYLEMSDNGFDAFPGDELHISVKGLKAEDKVKKRFYETQQ